MRRGHRLTLILVLAAALVAGLAWAALRPVPVTVELVPVPRGPMEVTVDVDGTTRIREVYEVAAPISGTARRSPVRVGDPVVKGQTVVASVEPVASSLLDARSRSQAEAGVREAEAALAVADSQLLQADEDLEYAEMQFDRAQTLVERGVAALTRLEDASQALAVKRAARDTAASRLAMAEGALERARAALIGPDGGAADGACCVDIRAPATGVVLSVAVLSERPVEAGRVLLSIGAPDDLEIVADPLSRDAVRIPAGAVARVERWGADIALAARLVRLDPSARVEVSSLGIEEQRVEAVFEIDGPAAARAGLGNGYAVHLRIVVWREEDVLQVPLGALFRQGGDWVVFVLQEGRARMVPVRIGQRNALVAEVLEGLSEQDQVVVHPSDAVSDGVAVVPAERE